MSLPEFEKIFQIKLYALDLIKSFKKIIIKEPQGEN